MRIVAADEPGRGQLHIPPLRASSRRRTTTIAASSPFIM
jgi:hypothetical protein